MQVILNSLFARPGSVPIGGGRKETSLTGLALHCIVAFQDQCKQTMINKHSNKHNCVKNPNWWEVDQLAIYKGSVAEKLISGLQEHQLAVRTGFEPATYGFQIRRYNHSAMLPPVTSAIISNSKYTFSLHGK